MYEKIDYLATTRMVFDRVVKRNRVKYLALYKAVLDALGAAPDAFITDALAAEAYNARKIELSKIVEDGRPIIVYTSEPYDFGVELIRKNYVAFGRFVGEMTLYPQIPEVEYILQVPGRRLCILRALGEYRNLPLTKLIRPISVPLSVEGTGLSGANVTLSLISPELILLDIYKRIYFVGFDDDESAAAAETVRLEQRLFDRLLGEYHSGKLGGRETPLGTSSPEIVKLRKRIIEALGADQMLVGQQALQPDGDLSFLQLVSQLPDHVIKARLEELTSAWLAEHATKYKGLSSDVMRYYLSIPSDTRLRRFRVFIVVPGQGGAHSRIAVADVFNAANYDVIARHPYSYLRFIMVDIWTIVLIRNLGEITPEVAERQLARLIALAKKAHGAITPLDQLKPADFFGLYIEEGVAARRERKNVRKDHDSIVYGALLKR